MTVISWSTTDVAGVEFGDDRLVATRLAGKGDGRMTLTHAGWIEYTPGGPERDVAAALKTLWKQAGMGTRTVAASLRSASLVMRHFKCPAMPEPELKSALELQAEEALQVPRQQLVVDWHCMESRTREAGSAHIQGVLVAAPLKDVERQLEILFMAGLDPMVVDIRAMAVANLFVELTDSRETAPLCLVNMSLHSADVIVLPPGGGAVYPHTVFRRASTWDAVPAFLGENIRDVLRYCEFKLDWEHVTRVLLTGNVPAGKDFIDGVAAGAKAPVEVWDPMAQLRMRHGIEEKVQSLPGGGVNLACSLGLGLRKG